MATKRTSVYQKLSQNLSRGLQFGIWGAFGGCAGSLLTELLIPQFWAETNTSAVSIAVEVGIWFGIIGICIAIALLIGHSKYLKKKTQVKKALLIGSPVGLIAGFVAGAIAQGIYTAVGPTEVLRIICWGIAGGLLGLGLSVRVPNLGILRGFAGGCIGGLIGGSLFVVFTLLVNQILGRLFGVAAIGFFIGLMIVLVEAVLREAWLVVHWTPTEYKTISLGRQPIILGSSDDSHVYLRKDHGYPPVTAKVFMQGKNIFMEFDEAMRTQKGMKILKQELHDGDRRKLGGVTLEVKTSKG